jgi:hypothetical protein
MTEARDLDDLSVLSRRGELAAREEQELGRLFDEAPTERYLHEAGRGFDLEASVRVEDDELVERIKGRFAEQRPARPVVARWRFALGVAAGLVLAATGALGLELARGFLRPTVSAPTRIAPSPSAEAEALRAAPPTPVVLAVPPTPIVEAPNVKPLRASARPEPSVAPPLVPSESADALFAAANRARSRGDAALAVALYRQLLAEHAGAKEATAARLSLGMLQLQRGDAAAALQQFQEFRRASPKSMSAEALFGEAEAFRRLGRKSEERAALQELLQRYPHSAYAVAAAKRLQHDP